jgi:hypothetical protein
LQDSLEDDSSTGNGALERPDNDPQREEFREGDVVEEDSVQVDSEYFDGFPQAYNGRKRDLVEKRRKPFMTSVDNNLPDGDGVSSLPSPEAPAQYPGSRGQTSVHPSGNVGTTYDERYEK